MIPDQHPGQQPDPHADWQSVVDQAETILKSALHALPRRRGLTTDQWMALEDVLRAYQSVQDLLMEKSGLDHDEIQRFWFLLKELNTRLDQIHRMAC